MKTLGVALIALAICLSAHCQSPLVPAQSGPTRGQARSDSEYAPSEILVAPHNETPAQQRIRDAKLQIAASPAKLSAFNDLAIAYLRRARETANSNYLNDADQSLREGLKLAPEDFQLSKTEVAILLAKQQYEIAKQKAARLNLQTPDDATIYGLIAEADIAIGEYDDAEKSTQWMLNMQPNNVPGLLLAAQLRALYGDADGALDLLNLAYRETSPTEVEDLAWIANQIASIQMDSGNVDQAASVLQSADQLFQNYPYTLECLARVRLAQHRPKEAVAFLLEASQLDQGPHVLYRLAMAQRSAGDIAADATLKSFREMASQQKEQEEEASLDLILLESNDPATASHSLALAKQRIAPRHDVWSLDAYAWALYANGRYQEADATIQKSIAVGIQSAQIYNHAGHIALKLNRDSDAERQFVLSIRTNPLSDDAADSRTALGLISSGTNAAAVETLVVNAQAHNNLAARNGAMSLSQSSAPNAFERSTDKLAPSHHLSIGSLAPIPVSILTPVQTDTDRLIKNSQSKLSHASKDAVGYANLGAAFFQRARETGDVSDYQLAEEALTQSLDLQSTDFSAEGALQAMAEVCMGEHRFTDALKFSQRALSLGSGDLSPFAIVGDSYADMGEYEKAGAAYARLDSADPEAASRTNYARDSRVSYLRFISGDTSGAIRLMKTAVAEALEARLPSENLAWLYYELGEYSMLAGDIDSANAAYLAALTIHPGDYRALAGMAKLRATQGHTNEAILLYQKAIAVVPMPIFIAELGDLYRKNGKQSQAEKQYQLVEYIGLLGHINQVLHNRDLAIFYADHDIKLAEALTLAQKELEVRHDVYTWDVFAWALFKNGQYADARVASDKAMQYGTQDPLLLFHAGMIAGSVGRQDEKQNELKAALDINPQFHLIYADRAREQLALLKAQASSKTVEANYVR